MLTSREKIRQTLHSKLESADKAIALVMTTCSLTPSDNIGLLLSNIQAKLYGIEDKEDTVLIELQDIYVNLIMGVMSQDMIESSEDIELLLSAIRKRIDNFDLYFEQLETGTFRGPF